MLYEYGDVAQKLEASVSNDNGGYLEVAHPFGVGKAVCRLKVSAAGEFQRLQEVQEGPQLLDAVLQWSSSDQKLVLEIPGCQLLRTQRHYVSFAVCTYCASKSRSFSEENITFSHVGQSIRIRLLPSA